MTVGKGGREWQRVLRGKEEALGKEEEEGEALDLREIKAEKRDS